MTDLGTVLWISAAAIAIAMIVLWLASLALGDSSIVDIFWGAGFVLVSWVVFIAADGLEVRRLLLVVLASVWGARLSIYLAWRNLGKGEDYRYADMRERWGPSWWWRSLFQVFLLQGLLMWVVSLKLELDRRLLKAGQGKLENQAPLFGYVGVCGRIRVMRIKIHILVPTEGAVFPVRKIEPFFEGLSEALGSFEDLVQHLGEVDYDSVFHNTPQYMSVM